MAHPAYKDWEDGGQVPAPPYRDAIEVWTAGEIKATEWPLKTREAEIVENAAKVIKATPASSGKLPDADDSGEHRAVKVSADIGPKRDSKPAA